MRVCTERGVSARSHNSGSPSDCAYPKGRTYRSNKTAAIFAICAAVIMLVAAYNALVPSRREISAQQRAVIRPLRVQRNTENDARWPLGARERRCPLDATKCLRNGGTKRARLVLGSASEGVFTLQFECDCAPRRLCGVVTDLRHVYEEHTYPIFRHDDEWVYGGEADDLQPNDLARHKCKAFAPQIQSHISTLCQSVEDDKMQCLAATSEELTACTVLGGLAQSQGSTALSSWARHYEPVFCEQGDVEQEKRNSDPAPESVRDVEGCLPTIEFLKEHVYSAEPVVMRGCASDMPALKRWTSDELLAQAGATWYGSDFYHRGNCSIIKYMQDMKPTVSDPQCDRYYARLGMPRQLRRDLLLPATLRRPALLSAVADMWTWVRVGSGDTGSRHSDAGQYIITQVVGSKEFSLFDGPSPKPRKPVLLSPGDVLFVPSHTDHVVRAIGGRNIAITLDVNFPPDSARHPWFSSAFSPWQSGVMPRSLAAECTDQTSVLPQERVTLDKVPSLDDSERIWDLVFRAGLGWDF